MHTVVYGRKQVRIAILSVSMMLPVLVFCREKEYIYLIQECKPDGSPTGFYKVGRTDNKKRRVKELQTGNPRHLVMIACTRNKVLVHRETDAHKSLDKRARRIEHTSDRFGGGTEWYRLIDGQPDQMIDMFKDAVNVTIDTF